jgi:hypothetical protein
VTLVATAANLLFSQTIVAQIRWDAIDQVDFSITIDQQFSMNSNEGGAQKNQTTVLPRIDLDLSDSASLTVIARGRFDAESALGFDGGSSHSDFELREFYLDAEWAGAYWRLGKQQIVWGQADGLRVLDVINPLELREFILPGFEDYRIPLWIVNAEIPLDKNWTAQFLLIPDQSYDEFANPNSSFQIRSPQFVPELQLGVPVTVERTNKPARTFMDADAGVRLSAFVGSWDLSLNYLYHYQDQPVLYQARDDSGISIAPIYERTHLLGGSFSNVFGDTAIRGEVGYSSDRFFLTNDSFDSDGIIQSGEFSYVLGLDYQGWRDWFVSAQVFQSIVSNDSAGLVRDKISTTGTFLVRRNFMNDSILAEILLIQTMSQDDGLLQVSLEYDWSTNFRFTVGSDIFFGSPKGVFGQFKENDRVSVGIEFGY